MSWNIQRSKDIFYPFSLGLGLEKNILQDRPYPVGDWSHSLGTGPPHMVFDETLWKYVKQLPPEDAKIKVSLQVDSAVYVRHEPVLPLIMHKRFCVREGSKWVHDKAKTPPLRRHVRRHGCHGRHHQWQAPTQVGTGRPWPAQQLGWPGLCSVAANLGVFLTKIYGISQFVGQ